MSGTSPPRNVIYFFSRANQIPSAGIGDLPYTDVIIAFLVPDDDLNLHGSGGAFDEKSPRQHPDTAKRRKECLDLPRGREGIPVLGVRKLRPERE
jgi:hypothetical protein